MKPILAMILCLQAGSLDPYYKLKEGTTWTYKRLENGVERKVTARVTGEKDGKVSLEWKELNADGSVQEEAVVTWSIVEGILTAEAATKTPDGEEQKLVFGVLKEGSKKDDRWTTNAGEFTHLGTAEVKVPAGTYAEAVRTQLKLSEDAKIDFYLVPKVGLVKIEIHEPDGGENRFELSEFKEPK